MVKRKAPVSILQQSARRKAREAASGRPPPKKRRLRDGTTAEPAPEARKRMWRCVGTVHDSAAQAVARVLHAAKTKKGGASIKSLTLAPHIQSKRATYAVTCETLKYADVLKKVMERSGLKQRYNQISDAVALVLLYDLLIAKVGAQLAKHDTNENCPRGLDEKGKAERAVSEHQEQLRQALQEVMQEACAKEVSELLPQYMQDAEKVCHPRYARVNLIKVKAVDEVLRWRPSNSQASAASLEKGAVDALLPELLVFPSGMDLHRHPLVRSGRLVLQSKSSCMAAAALRPQPGWTVLDACAAPGNKTTHLAALMHNRGRLLAFDKDPTRLQRLRQNATRTGSSIIEARLQDFLLTDPEGAEFESVNAILLDPSCSGSGTVLSRKDYLSPEDDSQAGARAAGVDHTDARVEALGSFQESALRHALRFPNLQRLVYSTCSVYRRENEAVVLSVLPEDATDGFFIALFERPPPSSAASALTTSRQPPGVSAQAPGGQPEPASASSSGSRTAAEISEADAPEVAQPPRAQLQTKPRGTRKKGKRKSQLGP